MNELNNVWRAYDKHVIPRDAPWIQKVESKRAWFAGAAAVADLIQRAESDTFSVFERKRVLDGIITEIRQFQLDVAADHA